MGHRAGHGPHVADARYRLLIDPQEAYRLRRHLRIGWAEWQGLPWYEQRALREELARELDGIDPPMLADSDEATDFARRAGLID
jgi:hypothetical protein